MDLAYQGQHPPAQLAAMAAKFNSDMNNLELSVPYLGGDEITLGNGLGLCITHTGFSTLKSSNSKFLLKNVLRCPQSAANLLSIQKFCKNNNCWFAVTANFFCCKGHAHESDFAAKDQVKRDSILSNSLPPSIRSANTLLSLV